MMQDGAGDQMRKIGDEQRVMRQRIARDIAPEGIDQECDLRKSVEGDADRQHDVDDEVSGQDSIEIGGKEAGIFEDAEHQQIAGNTGRKHGIAHRRAQLPFDQEVADPIIERDRRQQQQHKLPVAERIKGQ